MFNDQRQLLTKLGMHPETFGTMTHPNVYLCKKEKGNTKNLNLKTMKNLYHNFFLKFFEKSLFGSI